MAALLSFFGLTFLATWSCFWSAVWLAHRHGDAATPAGRALLLLGTFAPAFVALALTARAGGGDAVRALLARLFRWQVNARWYAFAGGFMIAIKLLAAVTYRVGQGSWPRFTDAAGLLAAIGGTLISTLVLGQSGEELGWRGYALPRLSERLGLAMASLVLGVIWALWHLPLFYLPWADTYGQSFPVYLAMVVALSVAIAWLYARTASLLLTMLMHAAINNTGPIVPSVRVAVGDPWSVRASPLSWITLGVLWLVASALLVAMRGERALTASEPEPDAA